MTDPYTEGPPRAVPDETDWPFRSHRTMWEVICREADADYAEIARKRIAHAVQQPEPAQQCGDDLPLFAEVAA